MTRAEHDAELAAELDTTMTDAERKRFEAMAAYLTGKAKEMALMPPAQLALIVQDGDRQRRDAAALCARHGVHVTSPLGPEDSDEVRHAKGQWHSLGLIVGLVESGLVAGIRGMD